MRHLRRLLTPFITKSYFCATDFLQKWPEVTSEFRLGVVGRVNRETVDYSDSSDEIPETPIEGVSCLQHLGFKKGMAIASLNINGLRSHLDEVRLMMKRLGIHILALNETKLDRSIPKELNKVSGYQQMRLDSTCHGGGISIYIRDSINFKPRDDISADGLELICIGIEAPKSKPFLVIAWYRPPSDPVGSFGKLEKVLAYLDREGKAM